MKLDRSFKSLYHLTQIKQIQKNKKIETEEDAVLYAHAISTTNSCQLCSLFFISDVKGLGLDPANLQYDEKEALTELGQSNILLSQLSLSFETVFSKVRAGTPFGSCLYFYRSL